MRFRTRIARFLGVLLFSAGTLLGIGLAATAAWADIEAMFYGFDKFGDKPLPALSCPVILTPSEAGRVTASFTNPTEKPILLTARAQVSNPAKFRTERTQVALNPGERKHVDWTVTGKDVDLGFFVFVRVASYPTYKAPFRESTCGMVMVNVSNLTGAQVFAILVGCTLGCLVVGSGVWEVSNRPLKGRTLYTGYAQRFLGVVVLAGMLASFAGWWVAGGLLTVLAVLSIAVTVAFVLSD